MRECLHHGKEPERQGTPRNYQAIWFCVRRAAKELFPDGLEVHSTMKWTRLKPIWIKLGEGTSWRDAITFGSSKEVVEDAAEAFGAEQVVWEEQKIRNVS